MLSRKLKLAIKKSVKAYPIRQNINTVATLFKFEIAPIYVLSLTTVFNAFLFYIK